MPIQEKKLIRLSMIVLLLSLLMVYLLLYQIKGDSLKSGGEDSEIETIAQIETTVEPIEIVEPIETGKNTEIITGSLQEEDTVIDDIQEDVEVIPSGIHMLSGTKLFYGKIDSVEKLGITAQYALLDGTGTFFIKLENKYDFENITRALGGNLYKIVTEEELTTNKLFGDKVVYINIPEFKEKLVLMLIYIDSELWLIQIDYLKYHNSKTYLKSLFID